MSDNLLPALVDEDLMEFGKHINLPLSDVPASYLLWLWDQDSFHKDVRKIKLRNYIYNNLAGLREESPDIIVNPQWENKYDKQVKAKKGV